MKTLNKMRFIPLLVTLSLVATMAMTAVPTMSAAANWVDLKTATNFAVLAGSTITNTGSSVITNGDLGLSPGTSVTGFPPGDEPIGAMYIANAGAVQAQTDLLTAYNYAAGQTPTEDLTGQDLGGLTLTPGVYSFSSSAQLTGTLTLNGQGDPTAVFIFQMGSTLTTATDSTVYLTPGTLPCHVFWQVGSSATLGTYSTFRGTILALTSITATTSATVYGRLLARNGAVTLDTNNITNTVCPGTTPPPVVSPSGGGGAPILPLIKVIKTPDPLALTSGPGSVTYTYTVTNPGIFALSNVSVTDNKVSPVTYVSGDVNSDNLLEPTETWIYTGKTNLDATTTNTATATGSANGTIVTSLPASATVVVTPPVVTPPVVTPPVVTPPVVTPPVVTPPVVTPPVVTPPVVTGGKVVTRTVKGGQIPKTSTPFSAPMYELLLIGAALTLFGAVGWRNRKRYE